MENDLFTSLRAADIRFVRVLWCDNANVIRGKAIHSGALARYVKHGVGITAGQQGLPVMYDAVVAESGLSPVGEIRLMPDWATLTGLPYASGHARVFGDMHLHGKPWPYCPRSFLKRMLAHAREQGIELRAGQEFEFYLVRPTAEGVRPFDDTLFGATAAMDAAHSVMDEIAESLVQQDIPVELYHPESGPGQQELSIRYSDLLTAADRNVAFRETVRAVAWRHQLKASFLPKVFADGAGSGCHVHLSLWQGDRNLLVGGKKDPHGLSQIARGFMAGVLKHLPGLMAITTPSCNSYRRLQPTCWSGAFRCWGMDNREAALRVPSSPDRTPPTHIELKTVDASANPYLALGAIVAAGLDGIRQQMDLPEEMTTDPGRLSDAERKKRGTDRLPRDLGEALRHFTKDKVLQQALGQELSTAFGAVRNAEWQALKGIALEEEVNMLLERY